MIVNTFNKSVWKRLHWSIKITERLNIIIRKEIHLADSIYLEVTQGKHYIELIR